MNCKKCGNVMSETEKFCVACGTPVENLAPVDPLAMQPQAVNNQAAPIVQPVQQIPENPMGMPVQNPGQVVMPTIAPITQPMGTNPMPVQQPQQPMNMGMMQPNISLGAQPDKKKNNTLWIIIAIIAVTVVIVVGLIFFLGKDKEAAADNNKDNNSSEKDKDKDSDKNPVVISQTYKIISGNYTFDIPVDYLYEKNDSGDITIYDTSGKWLAYLQIAEANTSDITEEAIKANVLSLGYTTSSIATKTLNGKSYIVANITDGTNQAIIILYKFNASHFIGVDIYNSTSTYPTDKVDSIVAILDSAKYDSNGFSISIDNKFDLKKIFESENE